MATVFTASTAFQLMSLHAYLSHEPQPRAQLPRPWVLLLTDGAQVPELVEPLSQFPAFDVLSVPFDHVLSLAELMWPLRPSQLSPDSTLLHVWRALLCTWMGIDPEQGVTLVVDSVQANPSQALLSIFPDSEIILHADGLMTYGPTRRRLPLTHEQRVTQVIYPDVLPGLTPLVVQESGCHYLPYSPEALRSTVDAVSAYFAGENDAPRPPTALIVGQYLRELGLIDADAESLLHQQMVDAAVARGARHIIMKPHPSGATPLTESTRAHAESLGVSFEIANRDVPAEVLAAQVSPCVVVSCFSTALATVDALGIAPVEAVGTELLLEALTPYQNSNRVPVTLCDVLFRADAPSLSIEEVQELVNAVGYCMQARTLPHLRDDAQRFVDTHRLGSSLPWRRYIKKRRAESLGLISPPKPQPVVEAGPRPPASLYGRVRRAVGRRVRAQVRGNQ